LEYESFSLLD